MIRLYDLRDQDELIAAMQETSLGDTDLGLAPEPLIGSETWWKQIDTPTLPRAHLEGQIMKVLWGSMADYPLFELRDSGGELSTWTREGDIRRYVEGLSARVEYVQHPWKSEFPMTGTSQSTVVLGIWVEESPLRSSGIAPGPGGTGFETSREHWEAVHYLCVSDRTAAEALLTALEHQGRTGRLSSGGTCGQWAVHIWEPAIEDLKSAAKELERIAEAHSGWYDGGEIIGGQVWGRDSF